MTAKQTVFSGIQPSGNLHIGNYLGAIKQFVELQKDHETIFCVVDEHAITVPQDPEELRKKTLEVAMIYLAAGIDPKKSIIFVQSHVPAHAELGWILNTMTPLGELERMTQFKDKKQSHGVLSGLLTYPTLMAADILLYQTDAVPVGEDQRQHIEFTRMIADKFNNRFGQTFKLPREMIREHSARIMGLDNPEKKMSKSAESEYNYIAVLDKPEVIKNKIQKAVTDSGSSIKYDPHRKSAISNLLNIFSGFSHKFVTEIEKDYEEKSYVELKKDLAEAVIAGLSPIQANFHELHRNQDEVLKILKEGAERAKKIAAKTMVQVRNKIGLI